MLHKNAVIRLMKRSAPMTITYINHSGFFVELDTVCLLFDWWKGELPELPDKPLLVFVSHRHADHFRLPQGRARRQ